MADTLPSPEAPEKLAALADCPFCGYATPTIRGGHEDYDRDLWVECFRCLNKTSVHVTEAAAITAWNTRALPQGYAAGVEAAAKVMDGYADRCEQRQASCKTDEGREEFKTQAQARRAMAAKIRSLSSADAVVEGWVLVPKEPTEEMRLAGIAAEEICDTTIGYVATIYRAMISATPPAVRGK